MLFLEEIFFYLAFNVDRLNVIFYITMNLHGIFKIVILIAFLDNIAI